MAGNLLFASPEANLGQPEIKLGVFAPLIRSFAPSISSNTSVTATFSVFNGGILLGGQDRQIPPHSGTQINNIFSAINQASRPSVPKIILAAWPLSP